MTKKMSLIISVLCTLIMFSACSSQKKIASEPNYKQISKQLEKDGFTIVGLTTLEYAVNQHLVNLAKGGKEIIGNAEGFKSENVGRQVAKNNAIIDYASTEIIKLKGKITSSTFSEGVPQTEFEKFYAAYQRKIQMDLDGILTESFSIIKQKDVVSQYRIYFIADENKAKTLRLDALKRAVVETQTIQKYATEIEKFINDEE